MPLRLVDDTAYNATTWDGVTGIAPSKNAVRDQVEAIAGLVTVANEAVDTTCFPMFATAATGTLIGVKSNAGLTFNSATGLLGATGLTVTNDATINGLTVGRGGGNVSGNTAIGASALSGTNTGSAITAIGNQALVSLTSGNGSVAIGHWSGKFQANGTTPLTESSNSIYIGENAYGFSNADAYAIVIGGDAKGESANGIVLGSSSNSTSHLFGTPTFGDGSDSTKKLTLSLSGITTGTTRTLTAPDASGTIALTSNKLSAFAATTSAELAGVISDETGTGALVFATSPTLVTPALGTPASGVLTNCTGTASGLTAGNVTTNANLTGPITSVGNATSIASQTGTGTKFVVDTSPTLVTPVLGVASATSLACPTFTTASGAMTFTPASGSDVIVAGARIKQAGSAAIAGYLQTNSGNLASTTALNPGLLVYGDGASAGRYGMDLGYNNSRYRTRVFCGVGTDISFGPMSLTPTTQSDWTEYVTIRGDTGNVGIGTTSPNNALSIGGGATRSTTQPTNGIDIFNGTAPVGTLTNGATLYVTSGEMRAMDAAGNATLISPHDAAGNWIHEEINFEGRYLRVHMERLIKALDTMLGGGYIEETVGGSSVEKLERLRKFHERTELAIQPIVEEDTQ